MADKSQSVKTMTKKASGKQTTIVQSRLWTTDHLISPRHLHPNAGLAAKGLFLRENQPKPAIL